MTIIQAIQQVLKESNKPLTYKEIYQQIIDEKLWLSYIFRDNLKPNI